MASKKTITVRAKKVKTSKNKEDIALKKQQAEAFERNRLRSCFYRDNYRRLILLLLLTISLLCIFMLIIYYMYSHRPEPQYYATHIRGGIVRLQPVDL